MIIAKSSFSFDSIYTIIKNGEVKKKTNKMIQWQSVTRENWQKFVLSTHHAFAIRTGAISNVTAIDCDSKESYEQLVRDFSELQDALTIKTANGYHIFCAYDSQVPTGVESFKSYHNVDIRSDDGLVFAPPTTYRNIQTKCTNRYTIEKTKCLFPKFPEKLKLDLKAWPTMNLGIQSTVSPTICVNSDAVDSRNPETAAVLQNLSVLEADDSDEQIPKHNKSEGKVSYRSPFLRLSSCFTYLIL